MDKLIDLTKGVRSSENVLRANHADRVSQGRCSPDAGLVFIDVLGAIEQMAYRARKLADSLGVPLAIIDKRRPRPNVCEATNVIGDVKDKDVIVVDDICDTGGSLVAGCNILKEKGVKDIYTAVTHGVFSGDAAKIIQDSPIKKMVITNTIPLSEEFKATCNKVTVLSVGWMLSKIISAISMHKPVSQVYALFEDHE